MTDLAKQARIDKLKEKLGLLLNEQYKDLHSKLISLLNDDNIIIIPGKGLVGGPGKGPAGGPAKGPEKPPTKTPEKSPQKPDPYKVSGIPTSGLSRGFVQPSKIGTGTSSKFGSFFSSDGLPPGEKIPSTAETASNAKNVYDKESLGYFYVNGKLQGKFLPSRFVNRN